MMSDLKRQLSWHEDFARNLSRFFSRSKPADSESNGSEDRETDGSAVTCSAEPDPHQTPEQHLNTTTTAAAAAQVSQPSDVPDGNAASQTEDASRGDAGGSAPQSASTVPPADGFLRRLGSLFHFSRAEPAGVQPERRSDADSSGLTTGLRDSQTSADTQDSGGGGEPCDWTPSVCHSELTHTPSEEQTEEDAVNIDAQESSEDKRRYDLACPPVVTYGTYRGLRDVRKPKKKHRVELHSPISEGEEATQRDGHEDEEIASCAVNTMSSDSQEYPTAANQASPSRTQPVPSVEPELTPAHQLPDVADSGPLHTCVEKDSVFRSSQAERSLPNDPVKSGQEHLAQTLSGDSGDLTVSDHHHTVPAPEQSSKPQEPSLIVDRWTLEDFQQKRAGLDEELLRMESKKMVDGILTNALAALHKMDASDTERGVLLTCEPNEGSEALVCEGSDGCGGRETIAEHQYRVMLTDHTLSVVLEETLAGTCGHVDCSRSPPSSGYESIAGSDTDIRCVVGVASDVTTTGAPIGSQNENQAFLEHLFEENEEDVTASHKSSGRNSLLSAAADDEPLYPNLHSHEDVLYRTDIKLLSEESPWDEQPTGDVSICEAEWFSGEKRPQDTAKDNCSNNCRLSLNGTCGTAPSVHQESPQQSQTLSVMEESNPVSHSLAPDMTETSEQKPPATQSHKSEQTEAPSSGSHEPICQVSRAEIDPSVAELQCSEGLHPSQWASVRAVRHEVADEPPSPEERFQTELGVNRADAGTSVVSVSGRRIHLDPLDCSSRTAAVVPQHSRFHDLDLHQVDGGFAIISEEEESDMVFVNDTGPMLSPSTRRAKAYPFSLSPIYEEEYGREEASGQETLQVPPATEEEQRSVEQQASSILSLLQSVSKKLQSSVICTSVEESFLHAPPSDRCSRGDDSEDDDEHSNISQRHQLAEAEPAHDTPGGIQEERDCDGTLGNVGKNANTPFYQYLNSRIMPSGDEEPKDTEHIVCPSADNAMITGEIGGFGKVNPRPSAATLFISMFHVLLMLPLAQSVIRIRVLSVFMSCDGVHAGVFFSILWFCVQDDSVPEIHLYPSSSQTVRLYSATDLTERDGPVLLSELCVSAGCWLVYDGPGFSGRSAVLESDGRVTPVLQNTPLSCVRSLRPLRMGGPRVTRPMDPKVKVFQKTQFQGQFRELLDHEPHLTDAASSLRVTGGIWVAFSSGEFRGHQCVLEEGEYADCRAVFGGSELWIQSLRCVQTDFLEPAVSLKMSDEEIHVHQEIPDLQETDGIYVKSGAWVAYSERCFTGQQYVLEKGCYPEPLDWGDRRGSVRSLRPIHRDVCRMVEPKFSLRVYSRTHYSGESREFDSDVPDCGAPSVESLRVIRGSWLLFDEERYSGNQYILGEGHYPDLTSCGCASTAIKSLKPIPYSFTEPSVSLFSLSGFEGLEETLCSEAENLSHFFIQSVSVHSGLWVAYQYARFRGRQTLLKSGGYPVWTEHCGWDTIGSMKPLKQPKAYVRLRSRALGSVLTGERVSDGSFPAKIFLSPADRSLITQRWIFTDGLLKNTAQRGCLSVIGAKACAGAPVALWEEHGRVNQRWSLNEDGNICSHLNRRLALDLKGGCGADRDHLILRELHAGVAAQSWDVDVL
ncbi:uncharacterized protein [Garra rufa]|uniref:uncharacterized protein n=1 Tax=Garra rufa TaxID=137080 RepID=UPI003CCE94EF